MSEESDVLRLQIHVSLAWGARAPEVGSEVQARVSDYLRRVAKVPAIAVDVVVGDISAAAA